MASLSLYISHWHVISASLCSVFSGSPLVYASLLQKTTRVHIVKHRFSLLFFVLLRVFINGKKRERKEKDRGFGRFVKTIPRAERERKGFFRILHL
jgi:23S rRNA A2030 N6-methylase RlmJ